MEYTYNREHMIEAIREASKHDEEWLYTEYSAWGNPKPSYRWFLEYDGDYFMLKPIVRLACSKAGITLQVNKGPKHYAGYARNLNFNIVHFANKPDFINTKNEIEIIRRVSSDKIIVQSNPELAIERKELDKYTCQACNYRKKINNRYVIDVHHLFPRSLSETGHVNKIQDLVCLCPNCHRIAHVSHPIPYSVDEIKKLIGIK